MSEHEQSEQATPGQSVSAEIIFSAFQLPVTLLLSFLLCRFPLMGDWSTTSQYQKASAHTIKDKIKWCPDKLTYRITED